MCRLTPSSGPATIKGYFYFIFIPSSGPATIKGYFSFISNPPSGSATIKGQLNFYSHSPLLPLDASQSRGRVGFVRVITF